MLKKIILTSLAVVLSSNISIARDYISIAGSSTVLPFATIIAEKYGKNPSFKTPVAVSYTHLTLPTTR